MAISMQVTLRRLGEYADLWTDSRTDLPWRAEEIAALSWLERRYALADLRAILERTDRCIRDRQEQAHGSAAIDSAGVTLVQLMIRALAARLLGCERLLHKWTAEEDAALWWLADRFSIVDLQVILRRPIRSIERRVNHLNSHRNCY